MSQQETAQVVQKVYDSFNTEDIGGLSSTFTGDIEFVVVAVPKPPFYRSRRGRDSMSEFIGSMAAHQEPMGAVDIREIIVQGNKAAAFGYAAWHVKSTDLDWETDFAHSWTVEGDKLTRCQKYTDTAAMSAAY